MSQELLKKANRLNQNIRILKSNQTHLRWCLSESISEREMEITATAIGVGGVHISIDPSDFKKVAFLMNEINEKQLLEAETEFKNCFKS